MRGGASSDGLGSSEKILSFRQSKYTSYHDTDGAFPITSPLLFRLRDTSLYFRDIPQDDPPTSLPQRDFGRLNTANMRAKSPALDTNAAYT